VDELLLFALASIGLCHGVVDSPLTAPVKDYLGRQGGERLVRMMNCYQCAGFWSGLLVGLIVLLGRWVPSVHLLLYGLAASFLGPLGAVFLGYLNALSSAAVAGDRGEPETDPASSASRDGRAPIPADALQGRGRNMKGTVILARTFLLERYEASVIPAHR
jgi:hypothetical protein